MRHIPVVLFAVVLLVFSVSAQEERPEPLPFEFTRIRGHLDKPDGPCWSARDNVLYYVEWQRDQILKMTDDGPVPVMGLERGSGPRSLLEDGSGHFWVTLQLARKVVRMSKSGAVLQTVDQCQGEPLGGPGRLTMDGGGGLYFTDSGSLADDWVTGAATGSVVYVPNGGEPVRVATGLSYPDGLALTPDGKFLVVAEHRQNRLMIYRVVDGGNLVDGKPFAAFTEAPMVNPDFHYEVGPAGLGCEPAGYFWVADYAAGRILRLGPDGQVLASGDIPKGVRPCGLCIGPKGDEAYYTEIDSGSIWLVRLKHAPQPSQREKKSPAVTTPQQRPHRKQLPTHHTPIRRLGP